MVVLNRIHQGMVKQWFSRERYIMIRLLPLLLICLLVAAPCPTLVSAGPPLQKCYSTQQAPRCAPPSNKDQPECGIEITCTDGPVQLGYTQGVCFRATCPGIWAVIHRRIDQKSFRERFLTYRHYSFAGYWKLKDAGIIGSGPVDLRELFLVLPEDLIEFRLAGPDCNARVELRNLGYLKKGSVCELQRWLADHAYFAGPALAAQQEAALKAEQKKQACGANGRLPVNSITDMLKSNPLGGFLFGWLNPLGW